MNLPPEVEKQQKKERFGIIKKEVIISIVISSLLSGIISYYVSNSVARKTAHRDFIRDFNERFFDNPKYRNISTAIEEQYLYGRGNILKINSGPFTDYEVDDYLYLLHDIWAMGNEGLIKKSLLEDNFAYHVCVTYNNREIREYRDRLREEEFANAHNFLDDLASEMNVVDKNCRSF